MKRWTISIGVLSLILFSAASFADEGCEECEKMLEAKNALTQQEKDEDFVLMFNGENLDGWRGDTVGYVPEDGLLVCKPGGNVYLPEDYANFIFRFEFKLTEGANNGVGIRAEIGKDAAYHGMEIQILDDSAERYSGLQKYQYHGSVYGVIPAKTGFQKPVGEWNCEEIYAKDGQIRVTLNGEVIVDANVWEVEKTIDGNNHPGLKNKSGAIGFLGHGDLLWFRNIRVKTLD